MTSSSTDIQLMTTTKKLASVMALCLVSSEGNIFSCFFTKHKKVNAEVYCNILEAVFIPWMKAKALFQ